MTVAELVSQLMKQPQDATVQVEGCDCINSCTGVWLENNTVLITCEDGVGEMSRDDDEPSSPNARDMIAVDQLEIGASEIGEQFKYPTGERL